MKKFIFGFMATIAFACTMSSCDKCGICGGKTASNDTDSVVVDSVDTLHADSVDSVVCED